MLLRDILFALDRIAPLHHAETWDNVGLIAGDPASEVTRALLTIDCTPAVMDEAAREGCELVVAYHPPVFEGMKRIPATSLLHRAIRDGMALYSPHTALDVAAGGTNDLLADVLGLGERTPLKPIPPRETEHRLSTLVPEGDRERVAQALTVAGAGGLDGYSEPGIRLVARAEGVGIGRAGTLAEPVRREALIERVKRGLGVSALLVAGPTTGDVTRLAVCAGAGRGLLNEALARKTELFLTGELPHHDALRAAAAGMTVVCALHSNSERATLPRLKERLEEVAPGLAVVISREDRDPFVLQ